MTGHRFQSFDSTEISWTEVGDGRPVVLLHGLFSDAATNWHRYGAAAEVAAAGFRVITPDLRGHGRSGKPHDPAAWPADVLARDIEALVAHLGLTDYDLGGYSLGARTAARLLARGQVRPTRAVLSGMGLQGLTGGTERAAFFKSVLADPDGFAPGTPGHFAAAFMRQNDIDRVAVSLLLDSQVATPEDVLRRIDVPTLVLCGRDDRDNGSAPDLALALPDAALVEVPGNHMSAVTKPDFGTALAAWLSHRT